MSTVLGLWCLTPIKYANMIHTQEKLCVDWSREDAAGVFESHGNIKWVHVEKKHSGLSERQLKLLVFCIQKGAEESDSRNSQIELDFETNQPLPPSLPPIEAPCGGAINTLYAHM